MSGPKFSSRARGADQWGADWCRLNVHSLELAIVNVICYNLNVRFYFGAVGNSGDFSNVMLEVSCD